MLSTKTSPKPSTYLLVTLAVVGLTTTACGDDSDSGTSTEDAAAFYEGETLTLVVPYSPGGGYDTYTRMLAPFIEEETGANVVVENQEGAGGLLAINELLTDTSGGFRIAIMNAVGSGGATIAGAEGPAFELDELAYIGRVGQQPHLVVVGAENSFESFDDVVEAESFRFGSTGPGAADFVNANVLITLFDLNAEIVTGFEGSSENALAVTRMDVDGMTGDFDSRIGAVEDGDHRPLLLIGEERRDEVPDTPTILEQDLTEEQTAVAEAHLALLALGRPFVAPPDTPEERVQYLRDVLGRVMENPDAIAESEAQGRPLNYLSGEDMDDLVQTLMDAPEAYREVLVNAYDS